MKKYKILRLYFFLVLFILLTSCDTGITLNGKLIDALSNKPLSRTSIIVEGLKTIETDENGNFKIKGLQGYAEYNFNLNPDGYTTAALLIENNINQKQIEAGTFMVIPLPPSSGVFSYSYGKYDQIPVTKAIRYFLEYGEPGEVPNKIAQSGDGRLAAWFLQNDAISSLPKIVQGAQIVVWQTGGSNGNNYYSGIAPLYKQEEMIITGNSCGSVQQAIIPDGWYLGLKDLIIGDYNRYCYAPLKYTIEKMPFKTLQYINGQNYFIIKTNLNPNKYAFLASEMDWNRNSSYAIVNGVNPVISSSVCAFEITKE